MEIPDNNPPDLEFDGVLLLPNILDKPDKIPPELELDGGLLPNKLETVPNNPFEFEVGFPLNKLLVWFKVFKVCKVDPRPPDPDPEFELPKRFESVERNLCYFLSWTDVVQMINTQIANKVRDLIF